MRAKGIQEDTKGIEANEEVQDYIQQSLKNSSPGGRWGGQITEDFLPECYTLQGCPNFLQVYAFS